MNSSTNNTGQVYLMAIKKSKSINSRVFSLACNKLNLKRREKIIFYRLLGFLIRNDKPFPYSIKSLSAITGYSRSSIFESINLLENLRIISRRGLTNNVKFSKGSMMTRMCSLVQKRIKIELDKDLTLVQKLDIRKHLFL